MRQITEEEWEAINDRKSKMRAINILRANLGYIDLRAAKNMVERIWDGTLRMEDIFAKASPCPHCKGTGVVQ